VRKRPVLIGAVALAAGVVALGSVFAQPPAGFPQPPASGGALPGTTVRPYGEWSAQPGAKGAQPGTKGAPAGGAVRPAGGSFLPPPGGTAAPNTAKGGLSRPGTAGTPPAPIQPAGGFDVPPPPNMKLNDFDTKAPAPFVPPAAGAPLPPPSLSVETGDNKFPPAPAAPSGPFVPVPGGPAAPTVPPAAPLVPPTVPTLPSAPPGAPLVPPTAPGALPPTALPPLPTDPKPLHGGPSAPLVPPAGGAPTAAAPAAPAMSGVPMPTSVAHSVELKTECPASVVFGVEFSYVIVVRNSSNVAVQGVRIEDEVPAGARYIGSDPPAELNGDRLVWAVGALEARGEKRVTVRVRPAEEGDLRSRATVTYSATAEARTKVTRPRIAVTATAQETARAGETAKFSVRVSNSGTGPAEKLILRAELTDGLYFSTGAAPTNEDLANRRPLETRLDALAAGESKTIDLPLVALRAGVQTCQFTVVAEGAADTTAKASVNVVEPKLEIAQTGPGKCLVRAEPVYEIALNNSGTAATDPVTVHSVLPDGFEFVQASEGGAYNATTRSVTWKLTALQSGGSKAVAVKLRAVAAGDGALRTIAVSQAEAVVAPAGAGLRPAGRVLEAKAETPIKSEGVAAVRFEVKDLDDPVLVGTDAVYEIRVTNQGTADCTNVQLLAEMPKGCTFSGASGAGKVTAQGQTLVFDPIAKLPVKGESVYTVRVRGNEAGNMRFRVQLTCDQVRTPVVKEESTSFYKQ
jgi:uncharacterized repeat protein (TIGR01451 family)